jgi:hypothetical protein
LVLDSGLVISELLASNDNDVRDEDRNRPDWVEITNTGGEARNLGGWFLTDEPGELQKWRFPEAVLAPGERLVVFASGKDRAVSGGPLHTNFQLNAAGEYLALVEPDGVTVAFEFGPTYPSTVPDVSYGFAQPVLTTRLGPGSTARIHVPTGGSLGMTWTEAEFDDSTWTEAVTGIGYNSRFADLIATNIESMMRNVNSSVYVRLPFEVVEAANVFSMDLSVQINDGFVAYLNGSEVLRVNAPATVAWNSAATENLTSSESREVLEFDLSGHRGLLQTGQNVLAIQGLNNDRNSGTYLLVPDFEVREAGALELDSLRFFDRPTAGGANGPGSTTGLSSIVHAPNVPAEGEDLVVTAAVHSTSGAAPEVALHYRVMFGEEVTIPMSDDGLHGDGAAGDGVFGATIPGGLAMAGQMVRYRLTAATAGDLAYAQTPTFLEPLNSQQYFGTVVENPAIESQLPVLHLFLEDPEAADTPEGTFGSLFHNGRFYDNVEVDVTGRSVGRSGPKKSHDVFLPQDHAFELGDTGFTMNDFSVISDYFNRDKIRVPLAYQTFTEIGSPAHYSVPVRMELNGDFYATYSFIDGGNDRFLERAGLDPNGALYKMNLGFSASGGFKKMTREFEDTSDLETFFAGLALSGEPLRKFLMDNVNIPATINYLVGLVVMGHGDCCATNLYIYRDTLGTGQWEPLPWDVDKSFGRGGVVDTNLPHEPRVDLPWPTSPGVDVTGRGNLLFAQLYKAVPKFTEMYLRRLRTVLDQLLKPPGTAQEDLHFERQIDEMAAQIGDDALLDFQKWGSWGVRQTLAEHIELLNDEYFPRHRVFLYGLVGDMDLNGRLDMDDLDDFLLGLTDPAAYEAAYRVPASLRGNTDFVTFSPTTNLFFSDLDLDYDDISRFVGHLRNGTQPSPALPLPQVGAPGIQFGTIDSNPDSGIQDEEYIELRNPGTVAVDLSGWRLRGGIEQTFDPGAVIPAGGSLYVTPNIHAFRARTTGPSGGQGLYVLGNYSGHIANEGETIELVAGDGTLVATVTTAAVPSPAQADLRISEIMFHPANPPAGSLFEADDFEFVELLNISTSESLELAGVAFTQGIGVEFSGGVLSPGERGVVVQNESAFQERYGTGIRILGQYGEGDRGRLNNGGELLRLEDRYGGVIQQFIYQDDWYPEADGGGLSLEVVDPLEVNLDLWGSPLGWRPSSGPDGTPGA